MKKRSPAALFLRGASLLLCAVFVFSLLGAPASSAVTAQEPTPTPVSGEDDDVTGQIVGGGPADPGEWPWQVALIAGNYGGTDYWFSQFCGGSLIAPQWVLTAAHCVVDGSGDPLPASAVDIVAGIYNLSSSGGSQRRDVSQIIVHPDYNDGTLDNDIALLRLASAVPLGGAGANRIDIIPLVPAAVGTLAGSNAWVTGWGNTNNSEPLYPEELHEAQLPVVTNAVCAQSYGTIPSNMLCAGHANGNPSACFGDSGGPLALEIDGQWRLAGVVSWGSENCNNYSVFARVSEFVNWVKLHVKPELLVESIEVTPPLNSVTSDIYANDDANVYITVRNISGVDAGPFTVDINVDAPIVGCNNGINRSYYMNLTGLAGGESKTLQLTLPAGSLTAGVRTIRAYADSGCAIAEDDEANNLRAFEFTVHDVPVAAPAHDDIANPIMIARLPYTHSVDVRGATRGGSDPTGIACPRVDLPGQILDAGLASVWYRYTPDENTTVMLDTLGSDYDTYIAVWQTPGTVTLIGCNDDYVSGSLLSRLSVNLNGGTTYLFQVAQYSNDITNVMSAASLEGKSSSDVEAQAGGQLKFNVTDGPLFADIIIYRNGAWLEYDFATGAYLPGSSIWTGAPGGSCIPAPMDYDGDGIKEFTQLCGNAWHFYNDNGSYNKGIWIGLPGAVPVPADYNGDGTDEVVVFSSGAWQFYDFATGAYLPGSSVWTGMPGHWTGGTSVPVPMDYNGNGTVDFTIYSGGPWHFYNANGSYNKGIWVGAVAGDVPTPGDYNGDGTEEVVIFRGGAWLFYDFATGAYLPGSSVWTGMPAHWTGGTSLPAPLDYNGDGKLDFTVYSGGPWHFYNANGSYNKGIWTGGVAGDKAISRRQLP